MLERGYRAIAQAASQDIHPPGYYWLLKLWSGLAGTSAAGIRSLSALAGLATVALLFPIARRLAPASAPRLGPAAAALAALSPFLVSYSQEARMYSLLALEGSLLFLAVLGLSDVGDEAQGGAGAGDAPRPPTGPTRQLRFAGLFALASAAGLWTHYSFPVLLAGANLTLLLVPRPRRPAWRLARLALLNTPGLLLFLPWLPTAWRAVSQWPAGGVRAPLPEALATLARSLAYGPLGGEPAQLLAEAAQRLPLVGGLLPPAGTAVWDQAARLSLVLALALPLVGLWRLRRQPQTLALALWILGPMALLLGRGLLSEAYLKLLLTAAPAWCLATAAACLPAAAATRSPRAPSPLRRRAARAADLVLPAIALALGALLPAIAALADYYRPPGPRDDYAGVAAELRRRGDAAVEAVLLCGPGQAEVWRYYDPGLPVLALPAERPPDAAKTVAALEAGLRGRSQLTALWWGQEQADPVGILEGWLNLHAFIGPSRWAGNLRVARYALASPSDCRPPSSTAVSAAGLRLLESCLEPTPQPAPERLLPVLLRWQAPPRPLADLSVSLQLLTEAGTLIAQQDGPPQGGAHPMSRWSPAETVEDRRALAPPPDSPPGPYRLRVVVYDPRDGQRVRWGEGDYVELGR